MDQIAGCLDDFAHMAAEPMPLALVSLRPALLQEVQLALTRHGLLDPGEDAVLGPVTSWALAEAARLSGEAFDNALSPALARRLVALEPLLPLAPGDDFAGRLVQAMLRRGDWVCRHPDAMTIVYAEGTETDGAASPARADGFDDARVLLRVAADGRPMIAGAWTATTQSGRTARDEPIDEKGPPRLQPGQFKAWVIGTTAIGTKLEMAALIQVAELPVRRDVSKDAQRAGDPVEMGLFVIDQHGGNDAPRHAVGDASAGCLVANEQAGHRAFMALLRCDVRWRMNNGYRFMTAVLRRADLV